MAISACLTPTDPIICAAIVGKSDVSKLFFTPNPTKGGEFARRHVPVNLRQILSAESAANDGLAYPFLTISIYLTLDSSREVAISHWILIGCLCVSSFYLAKGSFLYAIPTDQVFFGIVMGAILGSFSPQLYVLVLTSTRPDVLLPH